MTLHVAPSMRCNAPARVFRDQERDRALEYARHAARMFRIAYAVYQVQAGRPRLVRRYAVGR